MRSGSRSKLAILGEEGRCYLKLVSLEMSCEIKPT